MIQEIKDTTSSHTTSTTGPFDTDSCPKSMSFSRQVSAAQMLVLLNHNLATISDHPRRTPCCIFFSAEVFGENSLTCSCFSFQYTGGPKVYDVTKYLDDHPGGAEVMLDVAGQDADEFFEDIGHSKEARAELKEYLIGEFKLDEATKAKMAAEKEKQRQAKASGFPMGAVVVALLAAGAYYYMTQMQKKSEE